VKTIDCAGKYLLPFYKRVPLVVSRGKGCWVWDESGKRYLDMTAGIAVVNLGHRYPPVVRALKRQMGKIWHISNLFYQKPQVRLAEKLVQRSFDGMVFFANSGAEANDGALKIARLWGHDQGKTKVIALQQSFHGRTIATISLTGQEKYKKGFDPLLGEIVFVEPGDIEGLRRVWDEQVCALFLEVVQCEGGVKALPRDFVEEIQRLAREKKSLLVVDEVQTGMGRTGTLFGYQQFGIEPDIITLAKGLGNGFPIGAIVVRREVGEKMPAGMHASTFGGNFLACAVGEAVLDALDERFLSRVREKSLYLRDGLESLKGRFPQLIGDVRVYGLMVGVDIRQMAVADLINKFREEGVLVLRAGENTLRLAPPLVIEKREINVFLKVFEKILGKVTKG